ncbi:MAG: MarR family transcriptional regulator [Acidobacteriota bacterium]|nr:MarR family transcriptional regulator [Acidobacteriota bacterium]
MKDSLSFLFTQISNTHRASLEKLMCEIGLHAGQVFVLNSLWETDGQSQADLVRALQVSPPTITNMVARMAEAGFVELRKCGKDARLMRVYLTEKGAQIKSKVEEQWRKLEESMFSELSEPEKMMFSLLLKKIKK